MYVPKTEGAAIEEEAMSSASSVQKKELLQTLTAFSNQLLEAQGRDELFDLILASLPGLVTFQRAAIYQPGAEAPVRQAVDDPIMEDAPPLPPALVEKLWERLARQSVPLIVSDLDGEPAPSRSILAAPLQDQDDTLGILVLEHSQPHRYTDTDAALLCIFTNYASFALEKMRRQRQNDHTQDLLEALEGACFSALEYGSPESLARQILDIVASVFGNEPVSIYKLEGNALVLLAQSHYPKARNLDRIPLSQGVLGRCARTGEPQLIGDVSQDEDFISNLPDIQSELCVPILVNGEIYGVLNLESRKPHRFDRSDLRLLNILANRFSAGLQDQTRHNQTKDRLAIATLLNATALDSSTPEMDTAQLDQFTRQIQDLTNAQAVYLYIYDPQEECLVAQAVTDESVVQVGQRQGADEGISGAAFSRGEPITVADYPNSPFFNPDWPAEECDIGAIMAVPLLSQKTPLGVLEVHKSRGHIFDPEEIQTVRLLASQIATVLENQQLFAREQERSRQMAILNQITAAGLTSTDLPSLLETLARNLSAILKADVCTITLWDEEQQRPQLGATYGLSRQTYEELVIQPSENTITKHALESRAPVVVDDATNTPYLNQKLAREFPVKACLGLPLVIGERKIGAALIAFHGDHRFSPEEVAVAQQAADQAALVISKMRLIERERRQREFAETLLHFSYRLMSMSDVATAADAFLRTARQVVDYDTGSVMLLLPDAPSRGRIVATQGYTNAEEALEQIIPVDRYPLLRLIRKEREPVYLADVARSKEWKAGRYPDAQEVRSVLLVPFVYGQQEQVIGVATLKSYRLNAFSPQARRSIMLLCNQTASAMRNLYLFQETRRRLREVSLLAEVSEQLNRSMDLQETLQFVLDRMIDVLTQEGKEENVRGAIILRQGPDDSLYMAVAHRFSEEDVKSFNNRPFYAHEGTFQQSILQGKWVELKTNEEVRAIVADPFPGMDLKELLNVPLRSQEDVIGVISMSRVPKDDNTRQLLGALADLAGAAIQKVQLLNQARSQAKELMATYETLQEMDRLREEFIQSITHDLRAPLTFIRGYAELMLEEMLGPLTNEQKEALEIIQERTDTLANLISDMLDAKQLDLQPLTEEPVCLEDVAYRAVRSALMAAQKAGIDMVLDVENERNLVLGDERRLGQVFDNLISNAIKYSPNGGVIHVDVYRKGTRVVSAITDTGMGIPAEDLDHIWERYYRVKGSAAQVSGTGLGLANVRRIIEAHGGRIWVDSSPEGTTFTFELPLHGTA